MNHLFLFLSERLSRPLPGKAAHMRMIPPERRTEFEYDVTKARNSSVLILLWEEEGEMMTALIKRPNYNGVHSGQISFPGGKAEPSDISAEDTALREAREEVGVEPGKLKIAGRLSSLFIPPSYFLVVPVVAFSSEIPSFTPAPREVDKILRVELRKLLDPSSIKTRDIAIHGGSIYNTPYYDIDELTVWGATAMIISELTEILQEFPAYSSRMIS